MFIYIFIDYHVAIKYFITFIQIVAIYEDIQYSPLLSKWILVYEVKTLSVYIILTWLKEMNQLKGQQKNWAIDICMILYTVQG